MRVAVLQLNLPERLTAVPKLNPRPNLTTVPIIADAQPVAHPNGVDNVLPKQVKNLTTKNLRHLQHVHPPHDLILRLGKQILNKTKIKPNSNAACGH
jgi:hypothetical protein